MERPQKRIRLSPSAAQSDASNGGEDSTDLKLAILASLHPDRSPNVLMDYLVAYNGSVDEVIAALAGVLKTASSRKKSAATGMQSSLTAFATSAHGGQTPARALTKKGRTLHLYSPKDIDAHTPCSIIHNFLPSDVADALLQELLEEQPKFRKDTFVMFDKVVQSPHTVRLYVDSYDDVNDHNNAYTYNGGIVNNIAKTPEQMRKVSDLVATAVNNEIIRRMGEKQPNGQRLKFQSQEQWKPNASFVNCYTGGEEGVGWHSDHLTYLGPRAVIGSLSLGVAREFRVRKIVPQVDPSSADEQGQIAIHLPHNSLLVMHAEMQEEWKHSIAVAKSIDPHPVALNRRFNITYRCYKDYLHPSLTPRCRCDVAAVLRCVQKRAASRGRYMWMCYAGFAVGGKACGWFEWAQLDEDGKPPWAEGYQGNANLPNAVV